MGKLRPTRLEGHADHVGHLARRQGLSQPAGLDREGGRRFHRALGRRQPAVRGARVQDAHHLRRAARRQPAGLAGQPRRTRALLREGRGQDGRHPHQRHPRAARQQQLPRHGGRRPEDRLQGGAHRPHGDQQPAARRPRLLPADRLLLPGLQVRRQMVHALHRDPQGRGHRQSGGAAEQPGGEDRARRRGQGHGRRLCQPGRRDAPAKGPRGRRRRQLHRKPAPAAQ